MRARLAGFALAAASSALGTSCPPGEEARTVQVPRPAAAVAAPEAPAAARAARRAPLEDAPHARGAQPVVAPEPALVEADADEAATERDGADEATAPDALPPDTPDTDAARPKHALASIGKETWIYASPRWTSRRLGYLRAGAVVGRGAAPVGHASCEKGWYRIEPRGYVCVGAFATLDVEHPVAVAARRRPDRTGLPYVYALSGPIPPILYARVPTEAEARKAEPDLAQRPRGAASRAADLPEADEAPAWALAGQGAPPLANAPRPAGALEIARPTARSGFGLLSTFDAAGRRWGLTTELALLALDRTRVVKPSAFVGIALDPKQGHLPVAFTRTRHATRWVAHASGSLVPGAALGHREAVELTGASRRSGGAAWLEATDGSFVREDQILRVDPPADMPKWATEGRKWIDVSISQQTLVAFEGNRAVYVTLVSSGADGLGDPKTTHSTVLGLFRVHTKHVSVTMDDDAEGQAFDFRDVPFVQYFSEGFALHAAYWHDDFGTPRSHGCVNLAPRDAAWLFAWSGPDVPAGWHGALSRLGTLVRTRP